MNTNLLLLAAGWLLAAGCCCCFFCNCLMFRSAEFNNLIYMQKFWSAKSSRLNVHKSYKNTHHTAVWWEVDQKR